MRIAIIGGIGSGKSEALSVAKDMGFCALSADEVNARLLDDPAYIARLASHFPSAVKDGRVDRAALAEIVFSDKSQLDLLNSIAHPLILQTIRDIDAPVLVVEMPVIIESGARDMFDEALLVRAPLLRRLKFLRRRGMSLRGAVRRIKSQVPVAELEKIATHIVDNSSSVERLRAQVAAWLEQFKQPCPHAEIAKRC